MSPPRLSPSLFDRPIGFGLLAPLAGVEAPAPRRVGAAAEVDAALLARTWVARVGEPSRTPGRRHLVQRLADRAGFDALAGVGVGAGQAGAPEVKFLIDRQTKQVYFIPREFPYHFDFAQRALEFRGDFREFARQAYQSQERRYIPGTINAYDHYREGDRRGIYGLSFWSTDTVRAPLLLEAHEALSKAAPFLAGQLSYHPLGDTQEALLEAGGGRDRKALAARGVPILTSTKLSEGFAFLALNPGKAFGTLRVVGADGANQAFTRRDVVIYKDNVPADIPPLAGLATPQPQTYYSHVALKARQDKTPYCYARDLLQDPALAANQGQTIAFEVDDKGYRITPAEAREAREYFEKLRPKRVQESKPDLAVKEIRSLDQIHFRDAGAFGSKTANVAELHHLHRAGALNEGRQADQPEVVAPDGFGVPASLYVDFMNGARLESGQTPAERLGELLELRPFKAKNPSPAELEEKKRLLEELQEQVEDAAMPARLSAKTKRLTQRFRVKFPGEDIRIRSSSPKVEDLKGFSAAGLFDSYTFRWADADRPNRTFDKRLQKVFASVFNWRAFDEFDFYRIRPGSVAMAELIMSSTQDEVANGVVRWGGAIPGWDTITINAQVRDELVTNPQNGATPDVITVGNYGFNGEPEIQYQAQSNQALEPGRKHVLNDGEIRALFRAMKKVQEHFARLYGEQDNPHFSIECEFKITKDGKLMIKQARPWV